MNAVPGFWNTIEIADPRSGEGMPRRCSSPSMTMLPVGFAPLGIPLLIMVPLTLLVAIFPVNWVVHADGLTLKPAAYNLQRDGFVVLPVHVEAHRDLGELSLIDLTMDVAPFETLKMAVPGAQRLGLKKGEPCVIEMDLALIHIMPKKHRQ